MFKMSNNKGFSLIELIVVIAVIGIIAGIGFTVQGRFLVDTYLDTNTDQIAQALRIAQTRAMTGFNDDSWGVYFDDINNKIVLFKGTTYATRDTSFDVETQFPTALSLSSISLNGGGSEIVFDKLTGASSKYGSVQLSNNINESNTISVSATGLIALNESAGGGGGGGGDTTPPSVVSDLAVTNPTTTTLDVSWTATGDDGASGTATTYDLRYAASTITEGTWAAATPVTGEPTPSIAGTAESITVTGLSSSTQYFFALKTSDEVPNESVISNVASGTTSTVVAGPEADYLTIDAAGVALTGNGKGVTGITIENTGVSTITITQMAVSWTGGPNGNKVQGITINGSNVWTGNLASGAALDIIDFALSPSTTYPITQIDFSKAMTGTTLSITFTMSDATTKTINNITP